VKAVAKMRGMTKKRTTNKLAPPAEDIILLIININ
jgi:hypothetical protein